LVKLQKPAWIFFDGAVRPWDEAVLHVSVESVTRGVNVFEGLKGYWSHDDSSFGVVALPRHYARLQRSARVLHVPCPYDLAYFEDACRQLMRSLLTQERDMWLRAVLFIVEGHWGRGDRSDLVMMAYHQDKQRPDPINMGVSAWQRSADASLPPRVKAASNYQVARLGRIEGRERGCSEMVLLNRAGRVAEGTGSCILMVRDGKVVTTPATEGALESITVDIIEALCQSLGIPFVRRPIDRTELLVADELAITGTLAEIEKVLRIDHYELPENTPVLDAIADRFWNAVRQVEPHPAADLTIIADETDPLESR
jgi:branched-chain amino acid aminotransferase